MGTQKDFDDYKSDFFLCDHRVHWWKGVRHDATLEFDVPT